MRLLLDTHILIWLAEGHAKLPTRSRRIVEKAAREHGLAISAISFWETAMLHTRGRISLAIPLGEWRTRILAEPRLVEIGISGDIGIEAVEMPPGLHGDPADRLIVATARLHDLVLGTRDRRLLEYGNAGNVLIQPL